MASHAAHITPDLVDWAREADRIAPALAARAAQHDSDGSFVADNYALLHQAGLFTALVPAELGGGGASAADMAAALRRLGAACGSTALALSMHSHLVAVAAWRWRHQKAPTEALLRRVVTEQLVLVSSGGSDWLAGSGSAERVDGGYRITARKAFSSGCLAGDLLMTSAVLDDGETGPTVLHFAVPLKAAQVRIVESWDTLGMRGSGSHDVLIEGAFVPEAAISGRRPQGKWHPLFHCISMIAFPLIYAAYAGVADGARARALELAARRPADPGLLQRVGAMENAHRLMQLALADMVEQAVSGEPGPEATDRAMTGRTLVGEAAIDTVTRALEVAGGAGFYRAAGIERAFRDVQGARFHPLQMEAQQAYSARRALGLDIDG